MAIEGQVPILGGDIEHFPNGLHICHIYNDDAERRQTLSRFHSAGLLAKEQVLALSDVVSRSEFLGALAERGLEVPDDSEQLFTGSAEAAYCPGGHFEPQAVLSGFGSVVEGARAKGFTGVRISGEMAWAARRQTGTERILEYEAAVKEAMVRWPSTAACEYDARLFDGATILDILSVHPAMIVRGQILANPFFVDPVAYLARYRERHRRRA